MERCNKTNNIIKSHRKFYEEIIIQTKFFVVLEVSVQWKEHENKNNYKKSFANDFFIM